MSAVLNAEVRVQCDFGSLLIADLTQNRMRFADEALNFALLRNSRDVPSPRAWFFAREPEHLVVMFASDFVRRFQGAHWWSDIKSAHGDGFWGSDGMVQQIRFGGVVYQEVEPQANAMKFVDAMRMHRLLAAPAGPIPEASGFGTGREDPSIADRLEQLRELHSQGLISSEQLRARSDEILKEV